LKREQKKLSAEVRNSVSIAAGNSIDLVAQAIFSQKGFHNSAKDKLRFVWRALIRACGRLADVLSRSIMKQNIFQIHAAIKMYVPANSPKYICNKCRMKIPAEDLDAIFLSRLKTFLVSPKDIDNFLERAQETMAEKETLVETRKRSAFAKLRRDSLRSSLRCGP
jgi:hypothetical protein